MVAGNPTSALAFDINFSIMGHLPVLKKKLRGFVTELKKELTLIICLSGPGLSLFLHLKYYSFGLNQCFQLDHKNTLFSTKISKRGIKTKE